MGVTFETGTEVDLNRADRTLRSLKGKGAPYSIALGNGLSCSVATNGVRTLYLRARLHGKVQRLNLGIYPALSMKAAAEKAAEFRAVMKAGLDPRVEARRTALGDDIPRTVRDVAQRFIDGHLKAKVRARWAVEAERILRVEVIPQIGRYPLQQLQRTDLTGLVERKAAALRKAGGKGVAANRLAAVLSKLCSYGASQGWLPYELGRSLPKPVTETAKDRTLTQEEMGGLWAALVAAREENGSVLPIHARILSLLALTGCRCSEITGLRVSDTDLASELITVRGGKTQASNRGLLLPTLARQVLEEQLRVNGPQETTALLFPSPRVGTEIPSNEISRSARRIVKELGHQPWTPHDLRRTLATVLAEEGVPGDVARRITGHVATDIHGRVYDRATRREDMKAALTLMERWIGEAATETLEDRGNVVQLRTPPKG